MIVHLFKLSETKWRVLILTLLAFASMC